MANDELWSYFKLHWGHTLGKSIVRAMKSTSTCINNKQLCDISTKYNIDIFDEDTFDVHAVMFCILKRAVHSLDDDDDVVSDVTKNLYKELKSTLKEKSKFMNKKSGNLKLLKNIIEGNDALEDFSDDSSDSDDLDDPATSKKRKAAATQKAKAGKGKPSKKVKVIKRNTKKTPSKSSTSSTDFVARRTRSATKA